MRRISAPRCPGIGCNHSEDNRGGLKQDGIDHRLVAESDVADRSLYGEDDVKIADEQEIGIAPFDLSGLGHALAFVALADAARVTGRTDNVAGLAVFDMTAERGGPAGLEGAHLALFDAAGMASASRDPGLAVSLEDTGHLESRAHDAPGSIGEY